MTNAAQFGRARSRDTQLGRADERVLTMLAAYYVLTAAQVCRLWYASSSLTYVQTRLKRLVDQGYLERLFLPRPSRAGSAPLVYRLGRKGFGFLKAAEIEVPYRYQAGQGSGYSYLFLAHNLAVNEVLISARLLARDEPAIELRQALHDRELKPMARRVRLRDGSQPAVIPDGRLDFVLEGRYQMCLALELDRASQSQGAWRRKVRALLAWLDGPYQESFGTNALSIMALTTAGDERRAQLEAWTRSELERAGVRELGELFWFSAQRPELATPAELFLARRWRTPFAEGQRALLELEVSDD